MAFDCLKIYSFKKGVTLTELLVAMAIASGVSLGIVSIYISHYRIFTNQNALIAAETQNKLASDQILKYLHQGVRFSFLSGVCDGTDYGGPPAVDRTATTTVGITLLPLDANGNPFESGGYDHILFYRDPYDESKLVRVGYSNTNTSRTEAQESYNNCGNVAQDGKVVATGVTGFQIEYEDPGDFVNSKKADITLATESKTIYGKTFKSTQKFTAYFK